jgi:hypothetical protein
MSKRGDRLCRRRTSVEPDLPHCCPRRAATARNLGVPPDLRLLAWFAVLALG